MTENHSHAPVESRTPSLESINNMLKQRLDQKANEIRLLEDGDVYKTALLNEVMGENAAMKAAMDQIVAENKTLRGRLGIDELGPIEPLESELVQDTSLDT